MISSATRRGNSVDALCCALRSVANEAPNVHLYTRGSVTSDCVLGRRNRDQRYFRHSYLGQVQQKVSISAAPQRPLLTSIASKNWLRKSSALPFGGSSRSMVPLLHLSVDVNGIRASPFFSSLPPGSAAVLMQGGVSRRPLARKSMSSRQKVVKTRRRLCAGTSDGSGRPYFFRSRAESSLSLEPYFPTISAIT